MNESATPAATAKLSASWCPYVLSQLEVMVAGLGAER